MMYIDNIIHAFEKRRKRNIERINDHLCKQLAERVQDKKMYVAIDGTPMIDAASLNVDIITALQSIRATISRYNIGQ